MSKNIYVVDTNVLLSDPQAVLKFEENTVVIPLVVFEELDKQKSSDRDIARDARVVVRQLADLMREGDPLVKGVSLPEGGKLFVRNRVDVENLSAHIKPECNDDHIINISLAYQEENPDVKVTLVTNDINMQLKAKGIGVKHAEEYNSDVIIEDPALLPKGFINIPDGWMDSLPTEDVLAKSCGETHIKARHVQDLLDLEEGNRLGINDWLINEDDQLAARLDSLTEDEEFFIFTVANYKQLLGRKVCGIAPRNIYQAVTLDAILDPEIDLLIMESSAGSGKTLMSLVGGCELMTGKKSGHRMDKILFTRSTASSFDDEGFLPGNEAEKSSVWSQMVNDNMEVIAHASKNEKLKPVNSVNTSGANEDALIDFKSLRFMRGRSINNKFLIVDEAQDLTAHQVKTIITRAGENCKVILLGNLVQIDSPYLSPRTSGLTYATEKFHGVPFAKVMCLQGVQRSRLAEFAEEVM